MIDLVLEDSCKEPLRLEVLHIPIDVEVIYAHRVGPLDGATHMRKRQATLKAVFATITR